MIKSNLIDVYNRFPQLSDEHHKDLGVQVRDILNLYRQITMKSHFVVDLIEKEYYKHFDYIMFGDPNGNKNRFGSFLGHPYHLQSRDIFSLSCAPILLNYFVT